MVLLAACGDGGLSTPARETFEAIRQEAAQTPVDPALLDYASQACDPFRELLLAFGDVFASFERIEEEEAQSLDDLEEAFAAFDDLVGPYEDFIEALHEIEPPAELRAFHESTIAEAELFVEAFGAPDGDSFLESFLDTPPIPDEADEPEGFDAALIQACGDELAGVVERIGPEFLEDLAAPEVP